MSNINGNIIKENGITFYMESSSSKVCIDIDVDERLETFEFIKSDKVREYKLKNLKKSFPNIKKLVISSRIYIYISNTLFPNVREGLMTRKYRRYVKSISISIVSCRRILR